MHRKRATAVGLLAVALSVSYVAAAEAEDPYAAVRQLEPVGYWPLDEGEGTVLHDRSGNDNDGAAHHVGWENGLLDFTSAYQHAEIPRSPTYEGKSVAIGGWVFSRRDSYGGSGFHVLGNRTGMVGGGPISLCLRVVGPLEINVVSEGDDDAVGSRAGGVSIAAREWQHVLYSYQSGEGKLYVNGTLAQSSRSVPYGGIVASLFIGWDADGWGGSPPESQSLDGSVRGLVLFDRALSPGEVAQLYRATMPVHIPRLLSENEVLLDGRMISLSELSTLSRDERRRAYGDLSHCESEQLAGRAETLMPLLEAAVDDEIERLAAVHLLRKLDTPAARDELDRAAPRWMATLQDEQAPQSDRAACARALLAVGEEGAVPALAVVLENLLEEEGAHLPRVEDLLRNAAMEALLGLGGEDPTARTVLGRAFAMPVLDILALSKSSYAEAAALAAEGRFMRALDACRIPMGDDGVLFLTQNDPLRDAREGVHPRSYTCAMQHGGYTYKCGNGIAFDACEAVPQEDFAAAVEALSARYPEAAQWREPDYQPLCRARITREDAAGNVDAVILEGEHFIFDAGDEKKALSGFFNAKTSVDS